MRVPRLGGIRQGLGARWRQGGAGCGGRDRGAHPSPRRSLSPAAAPPWLSPPGARRRRLRPAATAGLAVTRAGVWPAARRANDPGPGLGSQVTRGRVTGKGTTGQARETYSNSNLRTLHTRGAGGGGSCSPKPAQALELRTPELPHRGGAPGRGPTSALPHIHPSEQPRALCSLLLGLPSPRGITHPTPSHFPALSVPPNPKRLFSLPHLPPLPTPTCKWSQPCNLNYCP